MRHNRQDHVAPEDAARLTKLVRALDRELSATESDPSKRVSKVVDRIAGSDDLATFASLFDRFDLYGFVNRWFINSYGQHAGGTIAPVGSWPFVYRGVVGTVRIPLVIGYPGELPLTIDGLKPALIAELTEEEIEPLKRLLFFGIQAFHDIQTHLSAWRNIAETPASALFTVAIQNTNSAVDAVSTHKLADAAFLSQQAVEKALKAFINHHSGQPWPRVHHLDQLLAQAVALEPGLSVFEADISHVNYTMGVRYGEVALEVDEAVRAVDITIRVVGSLSMGVLPPSQT